MTLIVFDLTVSEIKFIAEEAIKRNVNMENSLGFILRDYRDLKK